MTGPTALDLFCGAGGSSTGMAAAGVQVAMAANHWPLAVDVHQANHPGTDHDCADISAVDPRRYPATDILWASPECTNHSVARGTRRYSGQAELPGIGGEPDPAAERSRATMWDVPRFAEAMAARGEPYEAVVVENVVDARWWVGWRGWLAVMEDLGYDHRAVYLNSAFAHGKDYGGAPQYRDRVYVVFWRRGMPAPDLDVRPPAWCPRCETSVEAVQAWKKPHERWGRYRAQYTYACPDLSCRSEAEPLALPAAAAVDWSDLGARIGDRARPLATATRERIRAGLARYGRCLVPAGGTWNDEPGSVYAPFRTRTTRETEGLACPPMLIPVEARDGLRARPVDEPARTQTGRAETALAVPWPFLPLFRSGRPRTVGVDEPLATVVANGSNHGLAVPEPFVTVLRNNCDATPAGEPLPTVVAAGTHHGLTVPPGALLVPYYGTGVARPVGELAGTVTTRHRHALVTRLLEDVTDGEVDACTFRMLTPAEIGAAMAFPGDYLMRGAKRDQVRMYGNAVTPPAARLLLERLLVAHGAAP